MLVHTAHGCSLPFLLLRVWLPVAGVHATSPQPTARLARLGQRVNPCPGFRKAPWDQGRRGEIMPKGVSVRGRLLFAFLGISAFAVLAAAASMWAFLELGRAVQRITEENAPAALASLELSRQAERIAAGAPALLAAPNETSRTKVVADIRTQLANLEAILAKLRDRNASSDFGQIKASVANLGSNLDALDKVVSRKARNVPEKSEAAEPPLDHSDRHQPTGSAGCSRVGF